MSGSLELFGLAYDISYGLIKMRHFLKMVHILIFECVFTLNQTPILPLKFEVLVMFNAR